MASNRQHCRALTSIIDLRDTTDEISLNNYSTDGAAFKIPRSVFVCVCVCARARDINLYNDMGMT